MGELTTKKAWPMAMSDDNFPVDFPTPFPLIERFLSTMFGDCGLAHHNDRVYQSNGKWNIQTALPGVLEEDVKIATDGRTLTIEVDAKNDEDGRQSRSYYRRVWTLPSDIVGDPEAELVNGILTISWDRNNNVKQIPLKKRQPKEG